MAKAPLFKRLPQIWKRLDEEGILKRYLSVLDTAFDRSHSLARTVLDFRSVDRVPDRYLQYLGDIVGHQWRSDKPHDWNRSRIRDAVRRYSYKGTLECLGDLVRENGGTEWSVKDMASTILIPGRQGNLGTNNCFLVSPDYYHWGAFVLRVSDDIDIDAFQQDFQYVKAAGQVWYFEIVGGDLFLDEQVWADSDIGACGDTWRIPLLGRDWPDETSPDDFCLAVAIELCAAEEPTISEESYLIGFLVGGENCVAGQMLTVDLMIPVSEPDITVDQYHLTEAQALRQYSEETV